MPSTTLEQMEGRINAMREMLVHIMKLLPDSARDRLLRELQSDARHQNHQEDPGAVPNAAFAMEVARTKELEALLRDLEDLDSQDRAARPLG